MPNLLHRLGVVASVALGLALSQFAVDAQGGAGDGARLLGSWRVVSYELEFQDGGERVRPLGPHPNGYVIFGADGRMMAYLEAAGRTAPRSDEDRAAAYRTLNAYTGRYRVEGSKWITRVDGAWNAEWVGTDQERSFTFTGDQLNVITQWNPNPLYAGRVARGHLAFERER